MVKFFYISKEKITGNKGLHGVTNKITQTEWEAAVNDSKFWLWFYDTEEGQESYDFQKSISEERGVVFEKQRNQICGDYDQKKKFAKIYVIYNSKLGYIEKHHWTKQTKNFMQELYNLAKAIPGAMLLKGRTKVVTQEDIDSMK